MKKIKIVLMVVVIFIGLVVITHGQGSKVDEGVVGQITKTGGGSNTKVKNEQQGFNNTINDNTAVDIKTDTNTIKKKGRRIEKTEKELRFLDEEGKIVKRINIESQMELVKKK